MQDDPLLLGMDQEFGKMLPQRMVKTDCLITISSIRYMPSILQNVVKKEAKPVLIVRVNEVRLEPIEV